MKSRLALFVSGVIIWACLTWPLSAQDIAVGLAAAALAAFFTGNLFERRAHRFLHPIRAGYFVFQYVPVLVWECFKANFDVAYRVFHPRLPIHPGIVKVRTTLKSDTALTFLANSITLTPGTMTVDINKEDGILYVHWIDVRTTDEAEATRRIVQRFERILRKVFE